MRNKKEKEALNNITELLISISATYDYIIDLPIR